MAISATVASVGFTAVGAYSSYKGAKTQERAAQQSSRAQRKAEEAREQQQELDAMRRQREVIRQAQRARSQGLANATSQGAAQGSGLQGGYGQISGQSGVNFLGIQQNLELGREIFAANRQVSAANSLYAQGGTQMNLGQGLSSLGGAITANLGGINSLAQGFGGQTMLAQYGAGTAGANRTVGGYYFG